MSANPLHHPFYFCLFVDVIVTLSVDASRDLLDLSINGVTWTHLLNFPIWISILVFATFAVLRAILYSEKIQMAWTYVRSSRDKPRVDTLTELRAVHRRPRTVRINTQQSMFGRLSPSMGITSATPTSANDAQRRFV